MATYLYCLLTAPGSAPPPGLAGVDGAPVRALDAAGLVAWVSDVAETPAATAERARAHDTVVSAALAGGDTPLPARFGQRFADDAACRAMLERRAAVLREALDQVRGCVEMTVRAPLGEPTRQAVAAAARLVGGAGLPASAGAGAGAGAGRAYMERLRAGRELERIVRADASVMRARISGLVGGMVRREASRVAGTPPALIVSHLIPRDAEPGYRRALLGAEYGPLLVLGPSAPYSFAGGDD